MSLSNRINMRGGGGGDTRKVLSPLSELGESFTKWVQNSYVKHFSPATGNISTGSDNITIDSSNVATISQYTGLTTGFVTKCESGKSYQLNYNITYSEPSTGTLRIMYMNGSTIVSYTDYTDTNIAFAVPSGVTDVILAPRQSSNGNIILSINSFKEV